MSPSDTWWTWWVEQGIQFIVMLGTVGAVLWAVFSTLRENKARELRRQADATALEQRRAEDAAAAEAKRLKDLRRDFSTMAHSYLSRWLGGSGRASKPVTDQWADLRPTAVITGQGAYDIADWLTTAVWRINKSPTLHDKRSAFLALSVELDRALLEWIEDPTTHPKLESPFEFPGVVAKVED